VTTPNDAARALLESEQGFKSAFEHAAIGMALVGLDGRFVEVNDAVCQLLGYSREELLAATFQDLTHPEDLEVDLALVAQLVAGELRSYQLEKRYFDSAGAIVSVLLSVSLVRDQDGKPLYFISQIQDISERKRAQEALERSSVQLGEAQQIARIGSWERDAAGRLAWSDELYRIYGFDPAQTELDIAQIVERVHPDDREELARAMRGSLDDLANALEFRIVLPDGCERWIQARGEPMLDPDGNVIGRRGTAQDITDRKQAEQRLAAAEVRYRTMVEQLPLGTYIRPLDLDEPNIYASPQVEPLLGYPASAWESDPGLLARIVHPDDRERVFSAAAEVRGNGRPTKLEYRYVAKDGTVVWVQDETYVVVDDDGTPLYVQGFLLDISERKNAEADRDRLRDELHHAQKLEAIGRLAGGVAHDFNNMLTAIKGYSELLLDKLEPGTPVHEHAAQIKRASEQAATLPRQLLAFSRKQSLQPELVDLGGLVVNFGQMLQRLIGEQIHIETVTSAPAFAWVDAGQLEQALINLALNARDAMPHGGTLTLVTRSVDVRPETAAEHGVAPGTYSLVAVEDTGTGIDAETRARVFEPFFTTKPTGHGSGLGLSSVYGTISQSGGFIRLDSEPGRGTRFELYLPAARVAAAPHAPSVLLAEDEAIVRDLAVNVLEGAGYEVLTASDGREALAFFDSHADEIDVVVTDLVMPELSGSALAERIRKRIPETPIIYMSGYADERPNGDSSHFLQKPFSADLLVGAVRDAARAESAPPPAAPAVRVTLTPREQEILGHLAAGKTNEKVAQELGISAETVQSHVRNAMGKLDAGTRTEAVANALRLSLIS
jgi:two-component system, cell cycle sensor histidine kinase and response regulator CckA